MMVGWLVGRLVGWLVDPSVSHCFLLGRRIPPTETSRHYYYYYPFLLIVCWLFVAIRLVTVFGYSATKSRGVVVVGDDDDDDDDDDAGSRSSGGLLVVIVVVACLFVCLFVCCPVWFICRLIWTSLAAN